MIFSLTSSAQAYDGQIEYLKVDQSATVIDYKYSQDIVEKVLTDKLASQGLKAKSSKGFLTYPSAIISDINSAPADYAFKVDRKSRKDKDVTQIYLVIINPSADADKATLLANAKNFLNNLSPAIIAADLEQQISDQNDVSLKAAKKFKKLQDDQSDLEKKIKKLQDDLQQNAKDQDNQQKEVEKQQQVLETLKAKRSS